MHYHLCGKGEVLRQQCVLDRSILQGQEHDAMRPASVHRTGVWRVSPITTYGGFPQDGRNLPQDSQRFPTRRSGDFPQGTVRHRSRFRSCRPSRTRCCVLPFQMSGISLVPLAQSLNKNTSHRGQIWLFLVHYNRNNLIICYDEVQKLKQSGNHKKKSQ